MCKLSSCRVLFGLNYDEICLYELCLLHKELLYLTFQGNQKKCFQILSSLLAGTSPPFPDVKTSLATAFSDYFSQKIDTLVIYIVDSISDDENSLIYYVHNVHTQFVGDHLATFPTVTAKELLDHISSSNAKSSSLDIVPTWLLKEIVDNLIHIILPIFNKSLSDGVVPESFKSAVVRPLLKRRILTPLCFLITGQCQICLFSAKRWRE
jgi:hypothetical protein